MLERLTGRLLALLSVWQLARRWAARKRGSLPPAVETAVGDGTKAPGEEASQSCCCAIPGPEPGIEDVRRREPQENRRAETTVAWLLIAAALFGFAFTAVFIIDGLNDQLLGLAIGGMFALLAAAAIVAGRYVVVQQTSIEPRDQLLEEDAPEKIVEMISEGRDGVSRRKLLGGAAGLAGAAAVTAVAAPAASLGPRLGAMHKTPWHRGVRLVDEDGEPYLADQIYIGSFYTALPEGAYWDQLGAPLLVVRLPPRYLHLPAPRTDWADDGIVAYSKICTHAACAVSLYRYPTYEPTSDAVPAFTCPCHYSTFLPGEGGKVLFGPAGRPLPQIRVMTDSNGHLRAAGGFDEDVGPAWIDVRTPRSS